MGEGAGELDRSAEAEFGDEPLVAAPERPVAGDHQARVQPAAPGPGERAQPVLVPLLLDEAPDHDDEGHTVASGMRGSRREMVEIDPEVVDADLPGRAARGDDQLLELGRGGEERRSVVEKSSEPQGVPPPGRAEPLRTPEHRDVVRRAARRRGGGDAASRKAVRTRRCGRSGRGRSSRRTFRARGRSGATRRARRTRSMRASSRRAGSPRARRSGRGERAPRCAAGGRRRRRGTARGSGAGRG